MKKSKLLALALCGAMLLSACGGSSGDDSGAKTSRETDVKAAVSLDFTTMDPVDTSDTLSGGIQRLIMDGMFGFDDDMNNIPIKKTIDMLKASDEIHKKIANFVLNADLI